MNSGRLLNISEFLLTTAFTAGLISIGAAAEAPGSDAELAKSGHHLRNVSALTRQFSQRDERKKQREKRKEPDR